MSGYKQALKVQDNIRDKDLLNRFKVIKPKELKKASAKYVMLFPL
jgi:hypothetical protein